MRKERRKLGGIEYDAICLLSHFVPIYFVLWQLLGALSVGAWFQVNAADLTLQAAAYRGREKIIERLLQAGADVNAQAEGLVTRYRRQHMEVARR